MATPNSKQLHDFAMAEGLRQGFDWTGVGSAEPPPRMSGVGAWLDAGRAGEMHYLERRNEAGRYLREAVTNVWPWARSVVCGAVVYNSAPPGSPARDPHQGWISRYAWGDDYHDTLRARLKAWAERLHEFAGEAEAEYHVTVDTAPLVERVAAAAAGLGWQGKNTCLIHPKHGSWFFIGTVITSLSLLTDEALPDRCGSCTRCLDACPTQALTPYEMDARRCLAYLNIEQRGPIPDPFRAAMGDNILGCDICQEVCPWNRRAAVSGEAEFQPRPGLFAPLLAEMAGLNEEAYRDRFRRSAVKRAKFAGLRRNVAVAMGNSGDPAFRPQLEAWAAGEDALVAEHALWALDQLDREDAQEDDG
jgi:epoxyqueuosine reductase